jgi:D-sedoheptulose 7-phosphate isomerase
VRLRHSSGGSPRGENMHPVIVGKRALPAISLPADAATVTGVAAREGLQNVFAHQIRHLAEPADIALGISPGEIRPSVLEGLRAASDLGMLTSVALVAAGVGDIILVHAGEAIGLVAK